MAKISDVLDRARDTLKDPEDPETGDGVAYTNVELLRFVAAGIARAVSIRPDLRFGNYLNDLPESYAASDGFPLTITVLQSIADYVVFRAETKDDDHVNTQRSIQFLKLFDGDLLT